MRTRRLKTHSSTGVRAPFLFALVTAVVFVGVVLSITYFLGVSYEDILSTVAGCAAFLAFYVAPLVAVVFGWAGYYRYRASQLRGWFISRLLMAVERGVPLIGALDAIERDSDGLAQRVASSCRKELLSGGSLSVALGRFHRVFSPLHISVIAIGEKTGRLAEALRAVRRHHESLSKARNRLITHLLYPAWVALHLAVFATLVGKFLYPLLSDIANDFSGELYAAPLTAHHLFLYAMWIGCFAGIVLWLAIVILAMGYRPLRPLRRVGDAVRWRLPFFHQYELRTGLSLFANTVAELLRVGLPLHRASEIASELGLNHHLRRRLRASADLLKEGVTASEAFSEKFGYPATFSWAVSVGERSGNLASSLSKAGSVLSRRLEVAMNRAIEFVLPVAILILGAIAALFALSTYGTLRGLMDALDKTI